MVPSAAFFVFKINRVLCLRIRKVASQPFGIINPSSAATALRRTRYIAKYSSSSRTSSSVAFASVAEADLSENHIRVDIRPGKITKSPQPGAIYVSEIVTQGRSDILGIVTPFSEHGLRCIKFTNPTNPRQRVHRPRPAYPQAVADFKPISQEGVQGRE